MIVNAIKYTPDGGKVFLRSRPITMENNVPGVELSVTDIGIGLDAEHHELVFEKFYQVGDVAIHSSGKTSFKGGGPGLELALSAAWHGRTAARRGWKARDTMKSTSPAALFICSCRWSLQKLLHHRDRHHVTLHRLAVRRHTFRPKLMRAEGASTRFDRATMKPFPARSHLRRR